MTFINGFQPLTNVTKVLQRSIDVEEVLHPPLYRGGSRSASTSKMEHFVIIVTGFQPVTIITKRSILDVAALLDPYLSVGLLKKCTMQINSMHNINYIKHNLSTF